MRKVMTIVGTRPELIKMSAVIDRLDQQTHHILVHTGQNYDFSLNKIFFEDLGIREPDHFLNVAGGGAAETIANVILKSDQILELEQPEAVLIYGDTNSGLSVIAAKRRKIPVFHMEAGNRCFDQRVPEELNRKVIDHLSDVNMTLTEHARRYLLAEGARPETTFVVGSHMEEVLFRHAARIASSSILSQLNLEKGKYFLVSAHREENVDDPSKLSALLETLTRLANVYEWPVIVSTHPRTRKRLVESPGFAETFNTKGAVRFLDPFGFTDYVHLQKNAACVVSDSGTITEEASLLDFCAVTMRDAHERPEGMDAGTLIATQLLPERVLEAVRCALLGFNGSRQWAGAVNDYRGGAVSAKVVKIVLSYIDYINDRVWHKSDAFKSAASS